MAGETTFRVRGHGAAGEVILDAVQVDETDEGPGFYAFKALHADGVVCAAIWDNDRTLDPDLIGDTPVLMQCGPGTSFSAIGVHL